MTAETVTQARSDAQEKLMIDRENIAVQWIASGRCGINYNRKVQDGAKHD